MKGLATRVSAIPRAIDSYHSRTAITWFLFLFIALVVFPTGVIDGNETHYFMLADLFWSTQSEFSILNEKSAHFTPFAMFTAFFIDVLGYEIANAVLRVFCAALLAIGLSQLFIQWKLSALDALIIVASFLLFDQQFFGNEWIIRGFEGKVVAYAFVFFGMANALAGRWIVFVASMVIATYFHFLVGGFWTLVALIWLVTIERTKAPAIRAFISYSLAIAPLITLILVHRIGTSSIVEGMDTFQIYSDRVAHHIAPFNSMNELKQWMPGVVALFACTLALVTIMPMAKICQQIKLLFFTVLGLQIYLLIVFVASASDAFVKMFGVFYVFRPSSLTLLLLITLVILIYKKSTSYRTPLWSTFSILLPISICIALESKVVEVKHYLQYKGEVNELVDAVSSITDNDEIVLIQPGRDGMMPESRLTRLIPRPLLVNYKFVPTEPSKLFDWHQRIQFREAVFSEGCNVTYPVGALIFRNETKPTDDVIASCGKVVFQSENYSVVEIRENASFID
ncbi:MAG: hypothetical protein AAGJ37_08640 [Pseudomonadota bacterium]